MAYHHVNGAHVVTLTALLEATIDATEEAILHALVAGEAAEGANFRRGPPVGSPTPLKRR